MRSVRQEPNRVEATGQPGALQEAGSVIGSSVAKLRDRLATQLIRLGVTPNMLSVAGAILTACAAVCLLIGAGHAAPWALRWAPMPTSHWPLISAVFFLGACACDMLDGAVARVGHLDTEFGAVLDSTLDRCSDLLIYFACVIHFSMMGNVTYLALSLTAASSALLISYVKARAENLVEDCSAGYWQRGERCVVFLVGAFLGHVPTALWLLATLPALTVVRRMRHAYALTAGSKPWEPNAGMHRLMPWRHPRGSFGYGLCAALVIVFLLIGPVVWPFFYGCSDPLRGLLARFIGIS